MSDTTTKTFARRQRVQITAGSFAGYFAEVIGPVGETVDAKNNPYVCVRFEHSGGYKSYPAALLIPA